MPVSDSVLSEQVHQSAEVRSDYSILSSFYGVHTLQEFQQAIQEVHLNQAKGVQTVLILGNIPVRVGISLSFLRHVILLDSDLEPNTDVDMLRLTFDIGVRQVDVRVFDDL